MSGQVQLYSQSAPPALLNEDNTTHGEGSGPHGFGIIQAMHHVGKCHGEPQLQGIMSLQGCGRSSLHICSRKNPLGSTRVPGGQVGVKRKQLRLCHSCDSPRQNYSCGINTHNTAQTLVVNAVHDPCSLALCSYAGNDTRANHASGIQGPLTCMVATPCYRAPEVSKPTSYVTAWIQHMLSKYISTMVYAAS